MLKKAILLLVIFTIVSSNETPYQKAVSFFILSFGKQLKPYPPNYTNYVKNLKVDVEVLLTSNEKILIPKCDGIKQCIEHLENSMFVDKSQFTKFNNIKSTLTSGSSFVILSELIDNQVYYFYYKAKYNGDIVEQTETIKVRKCKKVIFWTKCENHYVKRPRPLNQKEIDIVNNAALSALVIEILTKLNKLK